VSTDEELERLRRRRMMELQGQVSDEQKQKEQEQAIEQQKQALLRRILTIEARDRLNRIKMVKPSFIGQLELQLIQIAQSGRISIPIDDSQLRTILARLQPKKREFKVRRV
jgi:programmed cell death protein 5